MMPWLPWKKKPRGSESYGVLPGALYSLLACSLFLLACSCSCLRLTSSLNTMVTMRKEIHGLWKLWCYAGCSGWRPFGPPNLYSRWSGDVMKRPGHKNFNAISHNHSRPEVVFLNLTWRSRGQISSVLLQLLLFAFSNGKFGRHVRFESLYISFLSSTKQQHEMTKFYVFRRTRTAMAKFWYLL